MKKISDSKCCAGLLFQLFCLTFFLLFCPISAETETLTGKPYVTDGDTVKISGEKIRLSGIDAPERNQRCKEASGKIYDCGIVSTEALRTKIGNNSIKCEGTKRDRYGRLIGICYLKETDLNDWMVRNGYALAYRHYSHLYISAEQEAQENSRGLWTGKFVAPWEWRRGVSLEGAEKTVQGEKQIKELIEDINLLRQESKEPK